MLQPYVTRWGSDPVWASKLPQLAAGGRRLHRTDLRPRLASRSTRCRPQAKVTVAGHEVYFDTDRMLWYSDIEIDNGDSYYPFVRLALARYQPHSLPGAHLSRISMTDFMQLAPDRTAELVVGSGAAGITVRGYSGENITGRMWSPIFSDILFEPDDPRPNTEMRAILQRRPKEIPGDLGWQPAGPEITLEPNGSGFYVTWTGTLGLPSVDDGLDRRVLITEIETFPRDHGRERPAVHVLAAGPRPRADRLRGHVRAVGGRRDEPAPDRPPRSVAVGVELFPVLLDDPLGEMRRNVLVVVERGAERAASAGD